MLKLTVEQALSVDKALGRLLKEPLPLAASWPLSGITLALVPYLQQFQTSQLALYKELGEEVPDAPGSYAVTEPTAQATLTERLKELGEMPITLSDFSPLSITVLGEHQISLENMLPLRRSGIFVADAT